MNLRNKIKNMNELYNKTFYFYQYNRYVDYYQIIKTETSPVIVNTITGLKIKGLSKINKYIQENELYFED